MACRFTAAFLIGFAPLLALAQGPIVDGDNDGVPDQIDDCPYTPPNTPVDAHGCSNGAGDSMADSDGDGVPDALDQCPYTEVGAKVDVHGCAFDSDHDGVADGLDLCPKTPAGAKVDAHGCAKTQHADKKLLAALTKARAKHPPTQMAKMPDLPDMTPDQAASTSDGPPPPNTGSETVVLNDMPPPVEPPPESAQQITELPPPPAEGVSATPPEQMQIPAVDTPPAPPVNQAVTSQPVDVPPPPVNTAKTPGKAGMPGPVVALGRPTVMLPLASSSASQTNAPPPIKPAPLVAPASPPMPVDNPVPATPLVTPPLPSINNSTTQPPASSPAVAETPPPMPVIETPVAAVETPSAPAPAPVEPPAPPVIAPPKASSPRRPLMGYAAPVSTPWILHFAAGSTKLDAIDQRVLDAALVAVQASFGATPQSVVELSGDFLAPEPAELATRRTAAIRGYLSAHGLPAARIIEMPGAATQHARAVTMQLNLAPAAQPAP